MTDISWTIHTASNGSVTVSGAIGDSLPTITVGRSVSIQFLVDTGGGGVLQEYVRYTNDSTTNTGTDIRGKPWFHQSVHPHAGFASALVQLEPPAGLGGLNDWWAVVTDASLTTTPVGTGRRVTLECFIIADVTEYPTREYVRDEFEAEL